MKVDIWEEGEIIKYLVFGNLEFLIPCIALTEEFIIGPYRNEAYYSEKSIYLQSTNKDIVVYIERRRK
jgi:hypothetical protein